MECVQAVHSAHTAHKLLGVLGCTSCCAQAVAPGAMGGARGCVDPVRSANVFSWRTPWLWPLLRPGTISWMSAGMITIYVGIVAAATAFARGPLLCWHQPGRDLGPLCCLWQHRGLPEGRCWPNTGCGDACCSLISDVTAWRSTDCALGWPCTARFARQW
jgi:hypothetical protein